MSKEELIAVDIAKFVGSRTEPTSLKMLGVFLLERGHNRTTYEFLIKKSITNREDRLLWTRNTNNVNLLYEVEKNKFVLYNKEIHPEPYTHLTRIPRDVIFNTCNIKKDAKIIMVIPCCKEKTNKKDIALNVYNSTIYQKLRDIYRLNPELKDSLQVIVLSSKLGFVDVFDEIEPYEFNVGFLDKMSKFIFKKKQNEMIQKQIELLEEYEGLVFAESSSRGSNLKKAVKLSNIKNVYEDPNPSTASLKYYVSTIRFINTLIETNKLKKE